MKMHHSVLNLYLSLYLKCDSWCGSAQRSQREQRGVVADAEAESAVESSRGRGAAEPQPLPFSTAALFFTLACLMAILAAHVLISQYLMLSLPSP